MTQLPLTKKESQVLDDVLNYMIDYMQDRVWSPQDRLAFDRIYSKNKSLKYWNAGVPLSANRNNSTQSHQTT